MFNVSLSGICLVTFIAKLNDLQYCATDIGNAYLEAKTTEKVYIITGSEFGKLENHVLVIYKALYGHISSGQHIVCLTWVLNIMYGRT